MKKAGRIIRLVEGVEVSPGKLPRSHPSLPRSTVMEALGRGMICMAAGSVFVTGGSLGSGCPFGPSDFHMYCWLPKETYAIGPENDRAPPPELSTAMRTSWALD